jgi:hypothetical protein
VERLKKKGNVTTSTVSFWFSGWSLATPKSHRHGRVQNLMMDGDGILSLRNIFSIQVTVKILTLYSLLLSPVFHLIHKQ